jgi:mono/diheme cytochrome c family protein
MKRALRGLGLGALALGIAIQFLPAGRHHTNPLMRVEPSWDSARTRELFMRACADCHSNETKWPWYSHVAPMSWLVEMHVDDGRAHLNLSRWSADMASDAGEVSSRIRRGEMPLRSYLLAHPEARLTASEKAELERGLTATFRASATTSDFQSE